MTDPKQSIDTHCRCHTQLHGVPVLPGWYWYRSSTGELVPVEVVTGEPMAGLGICRCGQWISVKELAGEWYGPLCEPPYLTWQTMNPDERRTYTVTYGAAAATRKAAMDHYRAGGA